MSPFEQVEEIVNLYVYAFNMLHGTIDIKGDDKDFLIEARTKMLSQIKDIMIRKYHLSRADLLSTDLLPLDATVDMVINILQVKYD